MEKSPIKKVDSENLGWGPRYAIFGTLISYFFSQAILFIPIALLAVYFNYSDVQEKIDSSPWLGLFLTGISSLGLLIVIWLMLKLKKTNVKNLGFKKPKIRDFGWLVAGLAIYFFFLLLALAAASLIPGFNLDQAQEIGYKNVVGWQIVLAFVGLVIIPPLAEEIVFRGFLYRGLATKWRKVWAAIFSSLLFALVHFQWNVGIDVFVLSLVLVFIYEKTKNLWVCVGLHAVKNMIAFMAIFVFAGR
jgi:membrane protease YdiL (CAAX protease family)